MAKRWIGWSTSPTSSTAADQTQSNRTHRRSTMLAREFGATDIVAERGERCGPHQGPTRGVGADAVLECVGTQESMMHAIHSTRPGGSVGYVGVPHGVELDVLPRN